MANGTFKAGRGSARTAGPAAESSIADQAWLTPFFFMQREVVASLTFFSHSLDDTEMD
jgi:hypothetical protein